MKFPNPVLSLVALSLAGHCAAAKEPTRLETVNSYTVAQEKKARDAVRAAGYDPGKVFFVQAGNFFFDGIREGHHYGLTVTPEGKVYASAAPD